MKLYISPPFGNYFGFFPQTTAIYGSFTLFPRSGLFSQIRKTLRYSPENRGWINKIGLRNKGIDCIVRKWKSSLFSFIHRNNIVSIAILEHSDIKDLLRKIPDDMILEINISCPNTDAALVQKDVHKFLNPKRKFCSIKFSPLAKLDDIDKFYNMGFRQFHFSNTLPVLMGGLSGIVLIPYTSALTKYTKDKYGHDVYIISGGGIRNIEQVEKYQELGCDAVSVSTLCFNPFLFMGFYFRFLQKYGFD